jgi:hypothetical protein
LTNDREVEGLDNIFAKAGSTGVSQTLDVPGDES